MDLKNKIFNLLNNKKSLFLIGPTDSGKSYFVKNELLPFLQSKNLSVCYFSDCEQLPDLEIIGDAVIIDEMETFQDKDFLEAIHSNEKPYYTDEYLNKVKKWFDKLQNVQLPAIYIITRNSQVEIQNFIKTVKKTEWNNKEVECVEFYRQK